MEASGRGDDRLWLVDGKVMEAIVTTLRQCRCQKHSGKPEVLWRMLLREVPDRALADVPGSSERENARRKNGDGKG